MPPYAMKRVSREGLMSEVWVTTVDNPFDPFTQWDQWYRYDEKCGYQTCERLAALANVSNQLSDEEYDRSITNAINTLCDSYPPNEVYVLAIRGKTQKFGR